MESILIMGGPYDVPVTNKSGVAWMCSFREGGIYSRGALLFLILLSPVRHHLGSAITMNDNGG
jgi:hypothetical protein